MIIRYTEWILKWRYLIILLSIIGVVALASGVKNLAFTNDYRVFLVKIIPS